MWKRLHDDVLVVWTHGSASFSLFLDFLYNIDETGKMKLESAKLRATRAKNVFTCQRVLRAYVFMCQRALCAYVLTCQRANVPTCLACLRAHVPICFACCRVHVPTCFKCLHVSCINMFSFYQVS